MTQRETPEDWEWPTWREAAINYEAIARELGRQIHELQLRAEVQLIDQLILILNRAKGTYQGGPTP